MSKWKRLLLVLSVLVLTLWVALPAFAQEGDPGDIPAETQFDIPWLAGLVSFFLPLVISFVKRADWSQSTKKVFALVVSAIAGVIMVGFDAGWSLSPFGDFLKLALANITGIWVVSQVAYLSFWEDTGIERNLEAVGSGPK